MSKICIENKDSYLELVLDTIPHASESLELTSNILLLRILFKDNTTINISKTKTCFCNNINVGF